MANDLKKLAINLLDLGKRNRLLNYKDSGYRGIGVIGNIEKIFSDIKNSKTYNIFKVDAVLEKYNNDLVIDKAESTLKFSVAKVMDITTMLLKNNDLLCYKMGYKTLPVIKRLYKEYEFSLVEKGINTLYMTFGMVSYLEGKITYKAPLLLIPLNIEYSNGSYKVHEYDDEVILNPTLDYYLKTSYKVSLPSYDDEAVTYKEYVASVKKALVKNLSIEDTMTIGIYSFLKMNMYNDLNDNQEEIKKNNNVMVLLGKAQTEKYDLKLKPLPIVNCDSSQLNAITLATNGNSFVLEGPPGSGKSQTITNIIASIIGQGKKVLFVSEKLAALNVVYENLKRANLADFALEIHSHKANKKEFITNLYQTANLPKYDVNDLNSKSLIESYQIENNKISSYYNELHKNYKSLGMTLYEAYNEYLGIDIEPINYRLGYIDISELNNISRLLVEFKSLSNTLGYDYRKSIFYGFKVDNDYLRYSFNQDVEASYNYLAKLVTIKDNLNKELKANISNTTSLLDVLNTISVLVSLRMYEPCFLIKKDRNKLLANLESYFEYEEELKKLSIIKNYNKKLIEDSNLENKMLKLKSYSMSFFKFLNGDYKALKREILAYRSSNIGIKELLSELDELVKYQGITNDLATTSAKITKMVDVSEDEFKALYKELLKLKDSSYDLLIDNQRFKELKNYLTDILIKFDSIKVNQERFICFSSRFDTNIKNLFDYSIDQALNTVKDLDLKSNQIGLYFNLCNTIDKLKDKDAMKFVDYYLDNKLELDSIDIQFKKCLLKTKIFEIVDKSINLSGFSSISFSLSVDEFKKLDEELLQANKAKIFSVNTKNRPNEDVIVEGSMYSKLVRENNKQRKQKPIRLLLEEIFQLATDVKPVFLMSPLSVSMYLPSKANLFDCVIFDEASQIFAHDAFGSIYRAKQCIIIGDTKQMPPSNFFNSQAEGEEEDEYEDNTESILDLAASKMNSSRLRWHYRSRSEELISFSNNQFYDHNLITIPQAKHHEQGFGIDFYYLNNGIYSENRTNMVEATFIKDMVIKHIKESEQSIGVIAFSNAQAALIEELIDNERANNPSLEKCFNKYQDEPVFVKNLETVQGDERDVIIFSICYGYNSSGKFYQRFGPLNNLGGERRLNVAITRAKYNIRIVSSILATDINDTNTESLGVKLLKAYLAYSKSAEGFNMSNESKDSIILAIKKYINSLGYDVTTNVGNSSFKIDLAISKNDNNILAIELDNDNASTSLTDNLRLHEMLLKRLGWQYLQVFSTAWVNNEEIEKKRIKEALEANNTLATTVKSDDIAESYLVTYEEENTNNDYVFIDEAKLKSLVDKDFDEAIKYLLEVESPIHIDKIYKTIAISLGSRVTNVLKNRVNKALELMNLSAVDSFYEINPKEVKLRSNSKLELRLISKAELEAGIYDIVKQNNGITVLGCYKQLIKTIGLGRLTEEMKNYLDDIVVYLKLDGKLTQRNESLFI